jgi:hypothetical protein
VRDRQEGEGHETGQPRGLAPGGRNVRKTGFRDTRNGWWVSKGKVMIRPDCW